MDTNVFTCTGRLGKDPEVRHLDGGKVVCNFSMAVSGFRDSTLWLRVAVWGKAAEACGEFLHKGSRVCASGELSTREYESNGQKRTSVELDARGGVTFLDPKDTTVSSEQRGADDGLGF